MGRRERQRPCAPEAEAEPREKELPPACVSADHQSGRLRQEHALENVSDTKGILSPSTASLVILFRQEENVSMREKVHFCH